MKKTMNEFREFIAKGNIVSMAVGVVMGGAFGSIVKALTDKILMPLVGVFLGGIDFTGLSIKVGEASIGYGAFIQAIIDFLIISLCMFFFVKAFAVFQKKEEEAEVVEEGPSEDIVLLQEIRDLLKENAKTK
ncbi:large conductance mechanosensitive channel protein [Firmicutes bacterium M10-2]|nr:large conductance mechanosensitive channel protein [Firmicutes bacterium M10-2]